MQSIAGEPVYSATDLVGFVECRHLSDLERAQLAKLIQRPIRDDPQLDRIAERGELHEERFLEQLRADGVSITEIPWEEWDSHHGEHMRTMAEATLDAMRSGVDVVFQATFFDGRRFGRADFLRRVDQPSALGEWSYEVWDTKLARHAKASAVLQLAFYSDLLGRLQERAPERMHLALGGDPGEVASFRVADFGAYYRLVTRELEQLLGGAAAGYPTATEPDPVEHCGVCRWDEWCRGERRQSRHLSLTAGISSAHRRALRDRGVDTIDALAALEFPLDPPLERGSEDSLWRVREQARIQMEGERAGKLLAERLEPPRDHEGVLTPDHGLLMLPPPSPGDLFFDIEGDPFVADNGLDGVDYLFGVIEPGLRDENGEPTFHRFWAIDEAGEVSAEAEKQAFEAFIDLVMERLERDPALHVYHYAPYEPTAMKRLMGRYATREDEVDRLLRGRVFVDLFRAVRQGVRASVESYSIKRIERFYAEIWTRAADLRTAGDSIVEFEHWLETGAGAEDRQELLDTIEAYNLDDCVSTLHLRDWLEGHRTELGRDLDYVLPRPEAVDGDASEELSEYLREIEALVEGLTADVPADLEEATEEQRARWLLAQLLGWHRREEKSFWWRYFFLLNELSDEERIREPEPLAGLVADGERPDGWVRSVRRSQVYRFRFPIQDHKIAVDSRPQDGETGEPAAKVEALDDEEGWIELSVGTGRPAPTATSLIPLEQFPTRGQRDAIRRVAEWVLENGIDAPGPYRAVRDLLLRNPPRLATDPSPSDLRSEGEPVADAGRRVLRDLDGGQLAIQGPPGAGKTWLGAAMIVDLVERGCRVGVTANSHKVIGQLLNQVEREAASRGVTVRSGQRVSDEDQLGSPRIAALDSPAAVVDALSVGDLDVVGATTFQWCRGDMVDSVDTLFVDEAGQISLANVVAASGAARNLVLLGDPQQLDQPLQGVHPPGADRSALAHLIGEGQTMPSELGLFLDGTYRLHPEITEFTSELFYDGLLRSHPGREGQRIVADGPLAGSGVRFVSVTHEGNDNASVEEAHAISDLIRELLEGDASWVDHESTERPLRLEDILVITPYNAQVQVIRELLPPGARVGTVDKFQGQEAPIAIYSMATSSADEAPRGMEFLYSLNRLNVATSRARALAVAVASPELVRVRCRSPRQMRLANALARTIEVGS